MENYHYFVHCDSLFSKIIIKLNWLLVESEDEDLVHPVCNKEICSCIKVHSRNSRRIQHACAHDSQEIAVSEFEHEFIISVHSLIVSLNELFGILRRTPASSITTSSKAKEHLISDIASMR